MEPILARFEPLISRLRAQRYTTLGYPIMPSLSYEIIKGIRIVKIEECWFIYQNAQPAYGESCHQTEIFYIENKESTNPKFSPERWKAADDSAQWLPDSLMKLIIMIIIMVTH